jgi:DNA-binding transcriptional LysR family regulator
VGPPGDPYGWGNGPVPASVLEKIPCVLPSARHGMRTLIDSTLKEAGLQANVVYEIDALNPVLSLIEQGAGFTILPYASVHRSWPAGQLASLGHRRTATDPPDGACHVQSSADHDHHPDPRQGSAQARE